MFRSPHARPSEDKQSTDVECSDCSSDCPFPSLSPSPQAPVPRDTATWTCSYSGNGWVCVSLHRQCERARGEAQRRVPGPQKKRRILPGPGARRPKLPEPKGVIEADSATHWRQGSEISSVGANPPSSRKLGPDTRTQILTPPDREGGGEQQGPAGQSWGQAGMASLGHLVHCRGQAWETE